MNFIYDIVLNFNKDFYNFFEWNKNDNIINVKKIPIFLIDNDTFVLLGLVLYYVATRIYFIFTVKSSKNSYNNMIYHLLHTVTSFFDITPSGRIINRAVKDSDSYDLLFPRFVRIALM